MKALILQKYAKTPVDAMALTHVADPQAKAGEVLVRMAAAGLNPADLRIGSGELKLMSPAKPPFVMGVDGAGVVASDGARFKRGDRVMFYTGLVHTGSLAEMIAIPEAWLAKVPDGWSMEEAAAAPLALLVAQETLDRSAARPGETLLVQGAGGSSGAATVALAAAHGLLVHGSGSGADEAYVRGLGAQGYSDYRKATVRDLGQRFDIALDVMGGASYDDCLAVVRRGGRIVSLQTFTDTRDLAAMGMKVSVLIRLLLPLVFFKPKSAARRAGVQLLGLASYQDGPALGRAAAGAVAANFRPRIDSTYPLAKAMEGFARLQVNPRGKVVVTIA